MCELLHGVVFQGGCVEGGMFTSHFAVEYETPMIECLNDVFTDASLKRGSEKGTKLKSVKTLGLERWLLEQEQNGAALTR